MAQTQIRKGFFFYFGLLVLLLIAVFLVLLVVMMFNPGKTVLWLQYFAGNQHEQLITTTDESHTPINFDTIQEIEINCTYGEVIIQKNEKLTKSCIDIVNNSKGFTVAADANEFSYSVVFEEGVLKIDIVEPTGFFYISKDIKIKINLFNTSYAYQNTAFTIKTTEGLVNIGGSSMNGVNITPKKLDVTTTSGDIMISPMANTTNCSSIRLKTASGSILANGNQKGITTSADVVLETSTGVVTLDTVNTNNSNLTLRTDRGRFVINSLQANNINVDCNEGIFDLNKIQGNLSFTPSEDKIVSPIINVNNLVGNFSLTATEGLGSKPKVTINKITGNVNTFGTNGNFVLKNVTGFVNAKLGGGSLDVTYDANSTVATDTIITDSASVKITLNGDFGHTMKIDTNRGRIVYNITSIASMNCNMYVNNGSEENVLLDNSKIIYNIGHKEEKNPLNITGSGNRTANVEIHTNDYVEFNLIQIPA